MGKQDFKERLGLGRSEWFAYASGFVRRSMPTERDFGGSLGVGV